VAAVLAMVERGDADLAVVYRTDAQSAPDLAVLDEATGPDAAHIAIVAGVVRGRPRADAVAEFFRFAASPAGQEIFARRGFARASMAEPGQPRPGAE
jgi:ABC-type molybdate transport system substrate-binding protein